MTDVVIPKHTVIQYIRNSKRVPYGVLVAIKDRKMRFSSSWSLCNKKDRFNKKIALQIAIGRAINGGGSVARQPMPHDIQRMLPAFEKRCNKYYKVEQ